jgi:hypothetical protein
MIVAILLFFVFTFSVLWIGKSLFDKKTTLYLLSGWIIKCLAGLLFIYTYTYYYGNGKLTEDSGAYMSEAKRLVDIKKKQPQDFYDILFDRENSNDLIGKHFQDIPKTRISRNKAGINDTKNHVKTTSLLMLVIGKNNSAIFMVFFFLSYLGFALLWVIIRNRVKLHYSYSFALLFLTPSLLFWTSSNLKEPTYVLGLCLVLFSFFYFKKSKIKLGSLLLGVLLLLFFKPELLLICFSSLISVLILKKIFHDKKYLYSIPLLTIVFFLSYFNIPNKSLQKISEQQFDFINLAKGGIQVKGDTSFYFLSSSQEKHLYIKDSSVILKKEIPAISNLFGKIRNEKSVVLQPNQEELKLVLYQPGGGSFYEISPINNNWSSFFKTIPEGLFNTFFRPIPIGSDFSILNLVFFLENLFFIFLITLTIKNRKAIPKQYIVLTISSILTVIVLSILIGISTPSSGALVRYRIPIHLLIIIVFFIATFKHEQTE